MKFIIRTFFQIIRILLGPVILFWDLVTTPKGIERPEIEQDEIDRQTKNLVLYQFRTCPFCIKVRRAMKRLSLNIEIRDAQNDLENREALLLGGGTIKVPCLKITDKNGEVRWMYESDEIIDYLKQRFA
ncbi:glutaredoxin family protein [Sulfuriflexus sp.]|uniref:glutaredoxin family protein n=1 Tax=Sulfuriflexus sp. TaxID=2015443 RepID=UPI0028CE2D9C|nr:glutathione S-transferase N-terminal domain-containing protein [Sulfuriflexus sp.]MDT8405265.1 glutathione S-transferase N-terminal domain-containing protein [Sulfuriflexus sp.]